MFANMNQWLLCTRQFQPTSVNNTQNVSHVFLKLESVTATDINRENARMASFSDNSAKRLIPIRVFSLLSMEQYFNIFKRPFG